MVKVVSMFLKKKEKATVNGTGTNSVATAQSSGSTDDIQFEAVRLRWSKNTPKLARAG